jgi:hypothetical protein
MIVGTGRDLSLRIIRQWFGFYLYGDKHTGLSLHYLLHVYL